MKSGEFLRLTGRALKTSYRARGATSTAVSVAGFALALLPTLISMALRDFTDAVQGVFTRAMSSSASLSLFWPRSSRSTSANSFTMPCAATSSPPTPSASCAI